MWVAGGGLRWCVWNSDGAWDMVRSTRRTSPLTSLRGQEVTKYHTSSLNINCVTFLIV